MIKRSSYGFEEHAEVVVVRLLLPVVLLRAPSFICEHLTYSRTPRFDEPVFQAPSAFPGPTFYQSTSR